MAGAPVGALRVTLGANTAQFEQGMRRAQASARRSGQDIERSVSRMSVRTSQAFAGIRVAATGLGVALGAGFLIQQTRSALSFASGLQETAQQIGVTVEQLQVLDLAAQQNGASIDGAHRAMAILNRTLGQAQAGLPAAVQAFRALGISQQQLQSFRNAGEAIPVVMEAISRFRTSAQQAAAAQRLFGRGAAELLPLLQQGRAGWDAATQAAIRNGMVTGEQARKADEAADSMAALGAALRVQLLGAIIDSLPGLMQVVRVLGAIITLAIRAIAAIGRAIAQPLHVANAGGGLIERARARLGVNPLIDAVAGGVARGANVLQGGGLAGGANLDMSPRGGGGGTRRNDAARRAHQFEQETRRLQIEELQARKENVEGLDERRDIMNEIVRLEHQQWISDQKFAVTQGEMTVEQYRRLVALKQNVLTTEQIGRVLEHTRAGQELSDSIAEDQALAQQEALRSHIDLARTAAERRRLELELLEISYRQRRNALEELIRRRPGSDEARRAEAQLADLPGRQAAETRGVMRNTMGPLESFMFGLPQTAAQVRESLQSIAVDGLQSITEGLVDVITGARKMGDVFRSVALGIVADLLRIQIQRAIIGPLTNALGGLFGGGGSPSGSILSDLSSSLGLAGARAAGGPVMPGRTYLVGEKGPELLRMGGTSGTVIANDNIGGSVAIHQTFKFDGVAVTKEEFVQGLLATRSATLDAVRQSRRRQA